MQFCRRIAAVAQMAERCTSVASGIRLAAMNLLARREHSRKELVTKLARRFAEHAQDIDIALDKLADEGLQSDQRFAESFVRQRVERGQGPLRIRSDLRQRGVSDSEVASAMQSQDFDWHQRASEVMRRKYGETPADDIKERSRRSRFMQYRGFRPEHYEDEL